MSIVKKTLGAAHAVILILSVACAICIGALFAVTYWGIRYIGGGDPSEAVDIYLVPLVLAALYPVFAIIHWMQTAFARHRLSQRQKLGLCINCLYDLTGNTSGVCPECGRAIPDHAKSAT